MQLGFASAPELEAPGDGVAAVGRTSLVTNQVYSADLIAAQPEVSSDAPADQTAVAAEFARRVFMKLGQQRAGARGTRAVVNTLRNRTQEFYSALGTFSSALGCLESVAGRVDYNLANRQNLLSMANSVQENLTRLMPTFQHLIGEGNVFETMPNVAIESLSGEMLRQEIVGLSTDPNFTVRFYLTDPTILAGVGAGFGGDIMADALAKSGTSRPATGSDSGVMVIKTTPCILEHNGRRVNLNEFYMVAKVEDIVTGIVGRHKPFKIVAVNPVHSHNGDYIHPHISEDSVCLGEGSAPMSRAMERGMIADAAMILDRVLHTYGRAPYHSIDNWLGRSCPNCGEAGTLHRTVDGGELCEECCAQSEHDGRWYAGFGPCSTCGHTVGLSEMQHVRVIVQGVGAQVVSCCLGCAEWVRSRAASGQPIDDVARAEIAFLHRAAPQPARPASPADRLYPNPRVERAQSEQEVTVVCSCGSSQPRHMVTACRSGNGQRRCLNCDPQGTGYSPGVFTNAVARSDIYTTIGAEAIPGWAMEYMTIGDLSHFMGDGAARFVMALVTVRGELAYRPGETRIMRTIDRLNLLAEMADPGLVLFYVQNRLELEREEYARFFRGREENPSGGEGWAEVPSENETENTDEEGEE